MERKKAYETTFIVNASLEDPQIEVAITHAQETITRNGGEVSAINRWGRRRLTYPIKKKNNGYYVNLEYTAPGIVITQLERSFILDENILRFLTIQLDKKAIQAKQIAPVPPPAPDIDVILEADKEPLFEGDEEVPEPLKPE